MIGDNYRVLWHCRLDGTMPQKVTRKHPDQRRSDTPRHYSLTSRASAQKCGLPFEVSQHCLHLAESVRITIPRRAIDSRLQAANRLLGPASGGQRLRHHEITGGVVRIVAQERVELLQRSSGFS